MNRTFAAAIVVLVMSGTALAPPAVRADQERPTSASAPPQEEVVRQNRHRAERAQRESAASAADALREATKLGLDIQLLGHKSIQIAGDLRDLL